jgi:hypothetical protein
MKKNKNKECGFSTGNDESFSKIAAETLECTTSSEYWLEQLSTIHLTRFISNLIENPTDVLKQLLQQA